MKVSIKSGVKLNGVKPETVVGMMIAQETFDPYDFVITSVCDGKHSKNSLHYSGNAFDCRIRHLTESQTQLVVLQLKKNLGDEFDVVREKTHCHIEYQP
jgi:hypothetical protein